MGEGGVQNVLHVGWGRVTKCFVSLMGGVGGGV